MNSVVNCIVFNGFHIYSCDYGKTCRGGGIMCRHAHRLLYSLSSLVGFIVTAIAVDNNDFNAVFLVACETLLTGFG